jgi:hypothetical protein
MFFKIFQSPPRLSKIWWSAPYGKFSIQDTLVLSLDQSYSFFQREIPGWFYIIFRVMVSTSKRYAQKCAQNWGDSHYLCQLQIFILGGWLSVTCWQSNARGRAMPMVWEHDIDICITPEEFPRFEKALASRTGYFEPKPIHYEKVIGIYQLIWQSLV